MEEASSLATFVLNGTARCNAPSGLKKALSFRAVQLAWRGQCWRDVDLPVPQIKEGIAKLPFKEELGVDFPVPPDKDEMARLASHKRVNSDPPSTFVWHMGSGQLQQPNSQTARSCEQQLSFRTQIGCVKYERC